MLFRSSTDRLLVYLTGHDGLYYVLFDFPSGNATRTLPQYNGNEGFRFLIYFSSRPLATSAIRRTPSWIASSELA